MNTPAQFRYTHLHNPRPLVDVRNTPAPTLDWKHCYFVGLRITTAQGDLYHHGMVVADNEEAFFEGIAVEYNEIIGRSLVTSAKQISVVFVRNLMMQDPELVDSAERQGINQEIQEGISRHDDRSFIVYGRVGESRICLTEVTSHNALTAINTMQNMVKDQCGESFTALEVCQSHPVTAEFDALFQKSVEQMDLFSASDSAEIGYLH